MSFDCRFSHTSNTDTDTVHHLPSPLRLRRLFGKACGQYRLLADGDRVLVAVSGGKDSLMLLTLLAAQAKIHRPAIEVAAAHVVMDNIPYAADLEWLERYCASIGVGLNVLHGSTAREADASRSKPACFLCSRERRKRLFSFARDNHYNKVALGHHQDDFLTTLLLNLTFEGAATTMRPAMAMRHYPLTVIRPLALAPERLVAEVAAEHAFPPQTRCCPWETTTNRQRMTSVLATLEALNPDVRRSMWHAIETMNSCE